MVDMTFHQHVDQCIDGYHSMYAQNVQSAKPDIWTADYCQVSCRLAHSHESHYLKLRTVIHLLQQSRNFGLARLEAAGYVRANTLQHPQVHPFQVLEQGYQEPLTFQNSIYQHGWPHKAHKIIMMVSD